MKQVLFILILFGMWACKQSEQGNSLTSSNKDKVSQELNSQEMQKLYEHFIPNPENLIDSQENRIIEYLIEHAIPAERLADGVYISKTESKEGTLLKWGDLIELHYEGKFLNGKMFDSSRHKGKPMKTYIGNGIDGWNQALQQLKVGERAFVWIPSAQGYGKEGFPPVIPPDAILVFDVEILGKIESAPE